MALRVLLADESTTIKKVMQLALQDFAVEVKTVHVGVDVVEVARTFQPDLIFADVLLQKRNGYEVCSDLKKDEQLNSIPVVLMWSSFMELDETLANECGADRRLEKPFEVESLRQLVLELVPRTRTQRLAHFLRFPPSFNEQAREEFEEEAGESGSEAAPAPAKATASPAANTTAKPAKPAAPAATKPTSPQQAAAPKAAAPEAKPAPKPVASATKPAASAAAKPKVAPAAAKPAPEPPPLPPRREEQAANWSMESFDDIGEYAEEIENLTGGGEPDDEEFSQFKITPPASVAGPAPSASLRERIESEKAALSGKGSARSAAPQAGRNPVRPETAAPKEGAAKTASRTKTDDRDPWSHQDLSRFKLNLPPVSVENEDVEVETDGIDLASIGGDDEPSETHDTTYASAVHNLTTVQRVEPEYHVDTRAHEDHELEIEEDLALETQPQIPSELSLSDFNDLDTSHIQLEEADLLAEGPEKLPPMRDEDFLPRDLVNGEIPRLSAERLEEIIRAQSRDIIESVVRQIVPDIASNIIREELNRLLDDTNATKPLR